MRARAFAAAAALAAFLAVAARAETITVFAAASLREAMEDAAKAFEARSGQAVRVAYGASSALARQVEAGAPAQLFVSADADWTAYLQRKGFGRGAARVVATNQLVLVAPAARPVALRIGPGFPLAQALGNGRLALADPRAVPAGKYARAALEQLKVWDGVQGRVAPAADVRAALALVARGEAPLGIVYRTDAAAEPSVVVVDTFPAGSHAPIVYPALLLEGATPVAAAFLDALAGEAGRGAFRRRGFGAP